MKLTIHRRVLKRQTYKYSQPNDNLSCICQEQCIPYTEVQEVESVYGFTKASIMQKSNQGIQVLTPVPMPLSQ